MNDAFNRKLAIRNRIHELRVSGGSPDEIFELAEKLRALSPPPHIAKPLVPRPIPRKPCVHLGAALDVTVKTECRSCGDAFRVDFQAFACAVHGRCLPRYKPKGDMLAKWQERKPESEIYHLCGEGNCDEFQGP